MTELTIFGRGGQGGVTLAKLIATAYFLRGKHVQAFGVYAAERSGAPLQAFVRIDEEEITNHNQIEQPDHVVVLDRTLIARSVLIGLKSEGWIILNSPEAPEAFAELFGGWQVATVDATGIAVANGLGTRTVPIVNTTMLGAAAKVFKLGMDDVEGALESVRFGGPNVTSARQAYERARMARLGTKRVAAPAVRPNKRAFGILDADTGGVPTILTGNWATRNPHRRRLAPPCNEGCPAGNDVQGFVQAMAREEYDRALSILLETTPLPGVCGRVCPGPCMEACNRAQYDEGINIRDLERCAAQRGRRPKPTRPWRPERVAVVGSGPAGLAATYHLARLGYPITLIEVGSELGGLLRTGIPTYRLPRDVLDREIEFIIAHGVEVRTGRSVGRAELVQLSREFAAVFVATGLQELRSLNMEGLSPNAVVQGIDFLDRMRQEPQTLEGRQVVVVGGGNTAMDAARTARRLGASSVRVVYRRTRAQMPAIAEEIEEALEEGIVLDELVAPLRMRRESDGPILTCRRMRLGEADDSGRPRPVPLEGPKARFDIRCDLVILALGQSANLSILPEGSQVSDGQALVGLTQAPVFAGGDLATNDGTVSAAVGSGRRAALHVHRTLSGEDLFPATPEPVAGAEAITMHVFSHDPQRRGETSPMTVRTTSFVEVRQGLIDKPGYSQAVAEAQRCFSCGVCNQCDRCTTYCPEGILLRTGDEYRFDYDYCKGCGVCAAQCPRGVIYMTEL